jgi:hypothetical protein
MGRSFRAAQGLNMNRRQFVQGTGPAGHRALVLGGGGLTGLAWEMGSRHYLREKSR